MCKSKFFETVAATRTTGRITSTRRFRYDREVGDRAVRALFKLKRVVSGVPLNWSPLARRARVGVRHLFNEQRCPWTFVNPTVTTLACTLVT